MLKEQLSQDLENLKYTKNLRKPRRKVERILPGKVKLRTYPEDINAVEIKLNGRINNETILRQ